MIFLSLSVAVSELTCYQKIHDIFVPNLIKMTGVMNFFIQCC